MSIVFMGSPDFAVISLQKMLTAGLPVTAVVSQPDRPRGRGRQLQPTAVSSFALEQKLPLFRPHRLRSAETGRQLATFDPELFLVVAYRILPPDLLKLPRRGSINLHGSLLPRFRGAAPIQHALLAGETMTGLSTFLLDEQVDTGGILLQEETPIRPDDDYGSLQERMAVQGAELLLRTVQLYLAGELSPIAQAQEGSSTAPRIGPLDRLLDWDHSAVSLKNRIRALAPTPGAFCQLDEDQLGVFAAEVISRESTPQPGVILAADKRGILVGCGVDALLLKEVQLKGRKRMTAASFLNGHSLHPGARLGNGMIIDKKQYETGLITGRKK
ncbi:methionyl-tRNA formyltransferase [bacterium]|nr:methionyl-tRNA formyltransferase [bacterium]